MKEDRRAFEGYKKALLPYLGRAIKGSNEDLVLETNQNLATG